MPRPKFWLYFVATILVAFGAVWGVSGLFGPDSTSTNPPAISSNTVFPSAVWSHGRDGSAENAEEHWHKHGGDFPEFHSASEYEDGAHNFIERPPPGTLTKHRSNGDTLYYDPATNTFAVADSDGEPRTFFRPDSGRAYWDRQ